MAGRTRRPGTARADVVREIERWRWTVSPDAQVDLEPADLDRSNAIGRLIEALDADVRAHGIIGVSYDEDHSRMGTSFQVHLDPDRQPTVADAVEVGREIFEAAFVTAGLPAHVVAVSAVRGGDADSVREP
jgi:hypothetical protein